MNDTLPISSPGASDLWRMPATTSRPALLNGTGNDSDFRQLIYGIFTLSVNFHRIRDRMATALGLTGIQYHILMVIAELMPARTITVSVVADRLHTSSAYITMETKKLIARGLLDKKPNPDDGRSVLLELTTEGQETIEAFAPCLQAINDVLFADVGPETFRQFCTIVNHMHRTSDHAADLAERLAREHDEGRFDTSVPGIQR